jgi:hypothetical protein
MTSTAIENLPEIWDDVHDIPFFRIVAGLFTLEFCIGASFLLASNRSDEDTASFSVAEVSTTSANADSHPQPARGGIPVPVRRNRGRSPSRSARSDS